MTSFGIKTYKITKKSVHAMPFLSISYIIRQKNSIFV